MTTAHQLAATLSATVQPDANTRAQGESVLKQIEGQPGFLPSLLQVIALGDVDAAVKQAAAIYFKNRVARTWDPSREGCMSDTDKSWVKTHVGDVIAAADQRARNIRDHPFWILTALSTMITYDFRHGSWPELVQTIKTMLASDQRQTVYTGLLIFLELVRNYQWVTSTERRSLYPVLRDIMPMILTIAESLKPHVTSNIEATEMLKCIIKTYSSSIRLELSPEQQDMSWLVPWGTLFISIIELQLPDNALNMPSDSDEREHHVWWKLKKWAYQCFNTMFGRYACVNHDKKYNAFAKTFITQFAPRILETFLKQIALMTQGVWMSARVKQHIATFLEHAVKRKSTWAILLAHLEPIIVHFVFPLLCFSESDRELWDENPVDYIHKKIDPPMDDFKSPVSAASQLLSSIVKDRHKQSFMPVMTIINGIHTQYNQLPLDKKNPRQKYGILNMMSSLVDELAGPKSPIRNEMEAFLITYVVPDMTNPAPFLRSRACDTLLKFASEMTFQNDANLDLAFQHVLNALKDPELPVRVEAALALAPFFQYPRIHDAMTPHAASVMQQLMTLTNEIDMDTLTHVMEQLVFEYSEQLMPVAVQLATQLCETFMRIMTESKLNTDDYDVDDVEDKTMAAMGVLKTVSSLILSVEGSPDIVRQVESVVAPSVAFVLENDVLDLYEETFEIIETATYCSKSISPVFWTMLPLIYRAFTTDAIDYFEEMLPTLQNYIMFGKDVLVQSQEHLTIFYQIIMAMLFGDFTGQSDRIRACQLAEIMMLYLRGHIDSMIPKLVEAAHRHLVTSPAKTTALRIHVIELVINALFYNPTMTLALLEQAQWTMGFFTIWFNNIDNLTRVHDKRLSILTLTAILEMPVDQLPHAIQSNWLYVLNGVIRIFETYGQALEEREREKRVANGEEEDSDDDDVENDDADAAGYLDKDVSDDEDNNELEQLAHAAALHRPNISQGDGDADDAGDDDDDDDAWSVEGMMIEDVYFTTYLDEVDAYVQFARVMDMLTRNGRLAVIEPSLTDVQKTMVQQIMNKANENQKRQAEQAAAAAASS